MSLILLMLASYEDLHAQFKWCYQPFRRSKAIRCSLIHLYDQSISNISTFMSFFLYVNQVSHRYHGALHWSVQTILCSRSLIVVLDKITALLPLSWNGKQEVTTSFSVSDLPSWLPSLSWRQDSYIRRIHIYFVFLAFMHNFIRLSRMSFVIFSCHV